MALNFWILMTVSCTMHHEPKWAFVSLDMIPGYYYVMLLQWLIHDCHLLISISVSSGPYTTKG